jgi:homoserine dehydrogenase
MKLTVGIGLLGCGTVGANVARSLQRERDAIERRSGVRYDLRAIAVADAGKVRSSALDGRLFTRDARSIVDDPDVDLIVECIGGTGDAAELVERALDRGRHVVTANKDLLATQGPRLHALAASRGAALRFEGAVGGAIPILRTIDDALAGDEIEAIAGVVNGTCTSILSAMEDGVDYPQALAHAQRMGFAEADPSADVDGTDAAHKLAVLVQRAFGLAIISPRIRRCGIATVSRDDVERARSLGLRIRLIAAAARTRDGALAEVGPALVAEDRAFGQTSGAGNAVRVVARDAGALMLCGAGAGGAATASAVLGDVVSILRAVGERRDFAPCKRTTASEPAIEVAPMFASLHRVAGLPSYPLWDDAIMHAAERLRDAC